MIDPMDEFLEVFGEWLTETVTVRTFKGAGPVGPVLGAAVTVEGVMIKDGARLVRGSNADQRMSDASLVMPRDLGAHFEVESEVTLPDGRVRVVNSRSVDAVSAPLAHARVVLT